jgi:hypothetical protein
LHSRLQCVAMSPCDPQRVHNVARWPGERDPSARARSSQIGAEATSLNRLSRVLQAWGKLTVRSESALGHFGLFFGILAVLFMLGAINNSLHPNGTGWSAIYFPPVLWSVGFVFIVRWSFNTRPSPWRQNLLRYLTPGRHNYPGLPPLTAQSVLVLGGLDFR